jgi:hypothetical protein
MFSQGDLANSRFGMTEVRSPGGQPGDYEERLSQWSRLLRDSRTYATDIRQRKANGDFREILGSIP